jgi:hypothetical protein
MNIVLTNAGLQKIINAEQTGTAPVVISQIAFGSGQYVANASQIALQNEIKRLPVISGGTDDDHSIHVAAQDVSSDSYSVYEFGLFFEDGTLFAVYSQTETPILQKTISSVAQFECGIALQDVNIESISFGDVAFTYPYATETNPGIAEIATEAEAKAGNDNTRIITPANLQTVTATTERKGVIKIATNAEAQAGTDNSLAITPANLQAVTATETRKGVVELATNAEAQTGTDAEKVITPAALKAVTATQGRRGLIAIATDAEAQAGTNQTEAITPASLQSVTATQTRRGIVELATNAEAQTGTDAERVLTPASLQAVTATTSRKGVVQLSSNSEAITGTNTAKAVVPAGLKAALDARFNGVEIDEEGRVNNLNGAEPWSVFPSGRSVEMTARAGVCQKTLARFSNNTAAAVFNFFKSRASTIRRNGAVLPGDTVGQIDFIVDNGKMNYDAGTQGARVGLLQVEVNDDSTITSSGNTNTAIKGICRLYAMNDGSDTVGQGLNVTYEACYPSKNNALSSGTTTHRWKAVYAVNGTIQTSDENLKEEIGEIPEAVFNAWGKVKFVQYKFKDAVKEKGEKARYHIGLIAQRIVAAFKAEGLDAFAYGLVCRDALKDGGEILSLRYDECLALECAYERNRFDKILIKLKGGDK